MPERADNQGERDEIPTLEHTVLPAPPPRPASHHAGAPTDAAFRPGMIIAERFRIVALIGKGGMGEVYRADDLTLGVPVALKRIPLALASDPARLARFREEVRLARQVSHPHIARVYDILETDGLQLLTMEFIDGEDLASLLRKIGRLPKEKALTLARQICSAVAAAHDLGIIHRDLKPANIMIDSRGRARVTDFGVAGVLPSGADSMIPGGLAGTPAYMSPEQLRAEPLSKRSDLYSLGLVLYELFTGRTAITGSTLAELRAFHQSGTVARPSTHVDDLDPAVERVILQCLEPDPLDRPASALAVSAALPGGDPLAAALAAGETPSPELIAASGGIGAMRPLTAALCVAAAALLLVAGAFLDRARSPLAHVPPAETPDVMRSKAQEALRAFGVPVEDMHWFGRWGFDAGAIGAVSKLPVAEAAAALRTAGRTPFQYFYRQSAEPLVPRNVAWRISFDDPPPTRTGMTTVMLNQRGELRVFVSIPARLGSATDDHPKPDWDRAFALAGLDRTDFEPFEEARRPSVGVDQRFAWRPRDQPEGSTRPFVYGGATEGRPVYFEVLEPETREALLRADAQPEPQSLSGRISHGVFVGMVIVIGISGITLAFRNLRRNQGDRSGAIYIAVRLLGFGLLGSLLAANAFPTIERIGTRGELIARPVYFAILFWLFYIGVESLARARAPHLIITWSRLLRRGRHDPMVGRDTLIGLVAGALSCALKVSSPVLAAALGQPVSLAATLGQKEACLVGLRETVAAVCNGICASVIDVCAPMVMLIVCIMVLRRYALGALAFTLLMLSTNLDSSTGSGVAYYAPVLLGALVIIILIVRFGLLAAIVAEITFQLGLGSFAGITPDAWFAPYALVPLAVLVALAVYGFRTAALRPKPAPSRLTPE